MINGDILSPWRTSTWSALNRQRLDVKAGRGGLYLLEHPKGKVVERQYSHGGLRRLILPKLFLKTDRPKKELEVHEQVFAKGIATCEPVGWSERTSKMPFMRQYFYYTAYLEGAKPLPSLLKSSISKKILERMARTLHDLFRAEIYHRDLNLNNWLLVGDQPYLIDFDRATDHQYDASTYVITCLRRLVRSGRKLGFQHRSYLFLRFVVICAKTFGLNARTLHVALSKNLTEVTLLDRCRWKLSGGHRAVV